MRFQVGNFTGQLLEKIRRRGIDDRMHGVESQPVEMIVAQPHEGVVTEKSSYLIAKRSVQVDGCSPWSRVAVGEIGTETVQVVSSGSQVVVNNVKNNGQAARMAGVNQTLEIVRLTVSIMRRIKVDAV